MADQLGIYNGALLLCGERFLASLTENVEARRLLDREWSVDGIKTCLEEGQWHFAMRTVMLDYDTSVGPSFGYSRAFAKPDDWVVTSAVCSDEFFRSPLLRYSEEAGFLYSDLDTIYCKFVSSDVLYGYNLNKWPQTFREFVEAHFASKIVLKLTGSAEKEEKAIKWRERCKKIAKGKDAQAEPTSFPARGAWASSRQRNFRRDGGGRSGDLIG